MNPQVPTEYDNNVDNLSKYGPTFQAKVLACILSSTDFLQQSLDVINPNFFENDGGRWIVKKTVEYFCDYKTLPTAEVFKIELDREANTDLRVMVKEELRSAFTRKNDEDLTYVQNNFLEFAKNQALKSAIGKSIDLLELGKFNDIKLIIDKAMRSGQPRNIGHNWREDIQMRLSGTTRKVIGTGWTPIDQILGGGLGAGELGVIAAPAGIGKSWALATIGANAAKSGKRVAYYTLELNENYVGLRYDTIFTGIEPQQIPNHPSAVRDMVDSITGDIIIKYYPPRTITIHTIQAHLEHLRSNKLTPDIILIDYADLMRSIDRSDSRHQELGSIYEEIRGMSGELGIPCWTASQTQRCLVLSTIVNTPSGKQQIGDISVGDVVETHEGFKTVTKVFPVERQTVYKITTKSGKQITCSARHEFPVVKNKLLSIESGLTTGDTLLIKK